MLRKYTLDVFLAKSKASRQPNAAVFKMLPENFKDAWIAALLERPGKPKVLRPKEEYHVPVPKTANDLAGEAANTSKDKGSENQSLFGLLTDWIL